MAAKRMNALSGDRFLVMIKNVPVCAFLACLSIAVITAKASAADSIGSMDGRWESVGINSGSEAFLDLNSVQTRGKYILARSRIATDEVVRHGTFKYRSSIGTAYYNCSFGSWAPLRTVYFPDTSSLEPPVGEHAYQEDEIAFRFPVPTSLGARILREVCLRGAK